MVIDDVCEMRFNAMGAYLNTFVIVTRVSLILGDLLVLQATLSFAWLSHRAYLNGNIKSSLQRLLIYEGQLLFGLNCAQMILWVTETFQMLSTLVSPLTSIVISRFILAIRAEYVSVHLHRTRFHRRDTPHASHMSTGQFTSIADTDFEAVGGEFGAEETNKYDTII
ncbi:hypothetical protein CERSUDRAFT_120054 [Gelatoporia subvermispora B]|uniref:Uncharacterized protein n=1 Tax=Ceriporiopsis subvermispora (strain B) TaxID=914234 RepID=M2QGM6_CERS8|nr:hypothetical protein CERSUDRAFT_120054 [Gelatoporia subvermispora B]